MIDSALFLENDAAQATQVRAACPGVDVRQVSDSSAERPALSLTAALEPKPHEAVVLRYKAGILGPDIKYIKRWITKTAGQRQRTVLFDWGRTIIQMKGARLRAEPTEADLIALAGGSKRLAALRKMFNYLYENDVDIALLTNNMQARTAVFRSAVGRLLDGRPYTIIASGVGVQRPDKGRTLTRRAAFRRVCLAASRKRRR